MKKNKEKKRLGKRILKITAIVLAVLIILPLVTIYSVRGVNAIRFNISDGVQERTFVTLGGIEQAIHIRGQSTENPVIIWLHGGPGLPDTFQLSAFQFQMEHDYTFVRWSQRGGERTHFRNPDAPISFDILLSDLDELVDYVTERFNQPVYIVGHSWGSMLGITYASLHPEKIDGFVGVGQLISWWSEYETIAANTIIERALAAGNVNDAEQARILYEILSVADMAHEEFSYADFLAWEALMFRYLDFSGEGISFALDSVFSPWWGFTEKRWLISLLTDTDFNTFFERNRPLFIEVSRFVPPEQLEIPIAFIMGSEDFVTATPLVVDYYHSVEAPSKNMFILEGAGHSPMLSQPDEFAEALSEALREFSR